MENNIQVVKVMMEEADDVSMEFMLSKWSLPMSNWPNSFSSVSMLYLELYISSGQDQKRNIECLGNKVEKHVSHFNPANLLLNTSLSTTSVYFIGSVHLKAS